MGGGRGKCGCFGEGARNHGLRCQAERGEYLSVNVPEVREPETRGVGSPEDGWSDGGDRGDPGCSRRPKKGGAENPRGDGDALCWEDKLGHVVDGVAVHLLLNLLLLLRLLVLDSGRGGAPGTHSVAVLCH